MAAVSATDLQAGQLICLLDCERRVMTVQWKDTLKQWTVRHGLVLGSPLHEGRFRLPTIPPEAVFVVDRKGSRGPLGFRSLRADGQYLQAQRGSLPQNAWAFAQRFDTPESWELNFANKLVNCAHQQKELGFQFGRLFAVPRDEIMDAVAPAAQVIVNRNTGELVFHSPLLTGTNGLHKFPANLLFRLDVEGNEVGFRSPFARDGHLLQASSGSPDSPLVCTNTKFCQRESWLCMPTLIDQGARRHSSYLQIFNRQWPDRVLGLKLRHICFVEKEAFLADKRRGTSVASVISNSATTAPQERRTWGAEVTREIAAIAQQSAAKQKAVVNSVEQKLAQNVVQQEGRVRVVQLEEQAAASAKQLEANQMKLAESQQLLQSSANAAQKADTRVVLLEAKVAALQQELARVQESAQTACEEAENAFKGLQKQLHQASADATQHADARVALLEATLSALRQELAEVQDSAQRNKTACEKAKEALKGTQERLHQADKEVACREAAEAALQQQQQSSAGAAQKAEASVALLEAKLSALQQELAEGQDSAQAEKERASCEATEAALQEQQQADTKLRPWTSAMAALFIDPLRLTQGSLLGVSSSSAHTYSGTYRRTDSCLPTQVALKTLHLPSQAGMAAFEEQVQMFCQSSADSHHMCRVYGVSCVNKQGCLVMKLYPHTLADETTSASGEKRKLPMRVVLQRGVDICRGLQELHAAGIIMRSLKQANILLTSNGTAVLADFALAQQGDEDDYYSSRLPEMSHGQVVMTDKADVHALGCLLVEMCTGEPWDTGALTLKVFHPQADTAQSPFVHIMQRCLCVAPDGRPTAAKVLQDLEALQAEARPIIQQDLGALQTAAHPVQAIYAEATDISSPQGPANNALRIIPI